MKFILTSTVLIFFSVAYTQVPGSKIGSFIQLSDIGNSKIPGSASYSEPSQSYQLIGSGSNIWFSQDSFSFLHKNMTGDFILQTQVHFKGEGHEPHRKAGLMIRSTKATNSAVVSCTVHGDGLTAFQYRTSPGGTMKEIKLTIKAPDILQLERKGTRFTMSVAHFGEKYYEQQLDSIDLGTDVIAGIFICAHTNKFSEEVEFNNTRIFNTAPDDLVQYKSYIASALEVIDVATGHRQVLASNPGSIQAPNWTPDGKALIYNESGKLYRFDLANRSATILNTDFANKNNNDHVLTFDGKQIGISNQGQETQGKSAVYIVPVEGGVPKKVTEKTPSYFHGWSPDNQFLLYTAERNGDFDIYKISKNGGREIQLTTSKGLDDGSEFSPDGKYIYFCSTRTGQMQIWRMTPDGKKQTQLTSDDMNNWFPHVSPDNKWLVFISFPKEVPADKHPFYQHVYLRLMPVDGGNSKVIAYLYGGQGTMNVPSWSPDSKKIAFVSNGLF
ncbi:MAG TPA: SMP-30/gluconolactonase/LRE family protein [Flavisolibacter sp.]|nr:SMP-30/gluconolactonase/LRE family protein [Flavisolibacter sp.]